MKQQKMIAKQIQKGVKFYYKEVPDLYHDKKTAYDIDVDDNVKELIIPTDLKMNNTKKSFPSVKKLIINALVVDIQIPFLFFCYFFSFSYLICRICRQNEKGRYVLQWFFRQDCTQKKQPARKRRLFAMDYFLQLKCLRFFFCIFFVIGIDNSADTVVIPDSDNQDVTFASNVVCSSIKKIIVHSPDTVSQLGYTCAFAATSSSFKSKSVFKTSVSGKPKYSQAAKQCLVSALLSF